MDAREVAARAEAEMRRAQEGIIAYLRTRRGSYKLTELVPEIRRHDPTLTERTLYSAAYILQADGTLETRFGGVVSLSNLTGA